MAAAVASGATTIVFVHGNPETATVWDHLADRLAEAGRTDQLRLSPPGFGSDVPVGFQSTPVGYRNWLAAELERLGRPVDLVGHDWGGGHVVNLAMTRPDLLRSWASDSVGLFDPGYVWHPLARLWMTPGEGEKWIAELLAKSPEQRAVVLTEQGMEASIAVKVSPGITRAMGESILALYRAAAQPVMAELGVRLHEAAARPGLAIIATGDSNVGTLDQRRRSADRAGAQSVDLEGFGHWWLTEDRGRRGAEALHRFWASL